MDFLEIAKSRYSVRDYKSKKVEPEKLEKILLAAHAAPTAANLQPVRLIVVQEDEGLNKVGKAANLYGAPLAIIVCSEHTKAWTRPFDNKKTVDIDASILTDHMMMEATELGLGSVWICYFKPDVIRQEFQLPDTLEPINILAIGYADGSPADPERHTAQRIPLNELVHYEKPVDDCFGGEIKNKEVWKLGTLRAMDINGLSTGMASGHDEPLALANKGYISENLAARPTDIEKRHKNVQTKERQ